MWCLLVRKSISQHFDKKVEIIPYFAIHDIVTIKVHCVWNFLVSVFPFTIEKGFQQPSGEQMKVILKAQMCVGVDGFILINRIIESKEGVVKVAKDTIVAFCAYIVNYREVL